MYSNNLFDSHEYITNIQQIKEQVLYITVQLKNDRNFLNKHFQNAITNYFMEDYASQHLKEKMGLKTFKEVKNKLSAILDDQQKIEKSGTKYMNLIKIYYQEHLNQGTLEQYQQTLRKLAFSDEDKYCEKGSQDWQTICWKKATALFLLHHTQHTELQSVFEIWNSLFPEDPIEKKKKNPEEKKRQQNNDSDNPTSVKKIKKPIEKKVKEIKNKNNKQISPRSSDLDDQRSRESSQSNILTDAQQQQQLPNKNNVSQKNNAVNKSKKDQPQQGQQQKQQQNNRVYESTEEDLTDTINEYKKKLQQEENEQNVIQFDDYQYTPAIDNINNNANTHSIVVEPMNQNKLIEDYSHSKLFNNMDLESSKGKENALKNSISNFFPGNQQNFFNNLGFNCSTFDNEMQQLDQIKSNNSNINLPISKSLTFSTLNMNSNNNIYPYNFNNQSSGFNMSFFGNNTNNSFNNKSYNYKANNNFLFSMNKQQIPAKQDDLTNSLSKLQISIEGNNDKKYSIFDNNPDEFDAHQMLFNSINYKINNNIEDNHEFNFEDNCNNQDYKNLSSFISQVNNINNNNNNNSSNNNNNNNNNNNVNMGQMQMKQNAQQQQNMEAFNSSEIQTESNPTSSLQTSSNILNSNQYYLKNLSQNQLY